MNKAITVTFAALLFLIIAQSVHAELNISKIQAHYNLSDTSDSSTNARTLTSVGSITYNATNGKIGNGAGSFRTTAYVTKARDSAWMETLHHKGNSTVNMWVRLTSNTASALGFNLIYAYTAAGNVNGNYLFYMDNSGYLGEYQYEGSWQQKNYTLSRCILNNWCMVTLVHLANGTTLMYLNGTNTQNHTLTTSTAGGATFNLSIGNDGHQSPFNGTLDEFTIDNRTWSDTDITFMYNSSNGVAWDFGNTAPAPPTPDSITYTSINHTSQKQNINVNFTISLASAGTLNLTNCTPSFDNGTGVFVNLTNITQSGQAGTCNFTRFINSTEGATIRYYWTIFASNSTGTYTNTTSITSYVTADTPNGTSAWVVYEQNPVGINFFPFQDTTLAYAEWNLMPGFTNSTVQYVDMWYRASSSSHIAYWNGTPDMFYNFSRGSSTLTDLQNGFSSSAVIINNSKYLMFVAKTSDNDIYAYTSTNKVNWTAACGGTTIINTGTNANGFARRYNGVITYLVQRQNASTWDIIAYNSTDGCTMNLIGNILPNAYNPSFIFANNTWIVSVSIPNATKYDVYTYRGTSLSSLVMDQKELGQPTGQSWDQGHLGDSVMYVPDANASQFYDRKIFYFYGGNNTIGFMYDQDNRSFYEIYEVNASAAEAANQAPSLSTLTNTSTIYGYTDANITTTYTDPEGDAGTINYLFYVNGINIFNQTFTSQASGTTLNSILTSGNYTGGQILIVNATANDGNSNSPTQTFILTIPNGSIMYNLSRNVTKTNATITWNTNVSANQSISWGTTTSLSTGTSASASSTTAHSYAITSLTPNTLYYYNITSCDQKNECQTNGTFNFTTGTSSITINSPNNQTVDTDGSVTFNFTILNTMPTANCSLIYSGGAYTSISGITNGTPATITVSGITDGHPLAATPLHWSITCYDNDGTTTTSTTYDVTTYTPTGGGGDVGGGGGANPVYGNTQTNGTANTNLLTGAVTGGATTSSPSFAVIVIGVTLTLMILGIILFLLIK